MSAKWEKNNKDDRIWWYDDPDVIGEFVFSFDRKQRFYLYRDYPNKLTPEQKAIFDKENPFWVDFFHSEEK